MFVTREKLLKILNQNPETWALKHGIEPFEGPCNKCGKKLKTDLPIVGSYDGQKMYGLAAKPCECGNEDVPYCLTLPQRVERLGKNHRSK